MTKNVMIIGGGIAGTVAAMALQRAGLTPVVHEAYGPSGEGVGAFLTLAKNGLQALDVLSLKGPVEALGMDTPSMTMANAAGRHLATMPMRGRTLMRGDLYQVLRDEAVRRGIEVRYDQRLADAVPTGSGVRARFTDGSTAEADLLVGADGLRSRVRTIIDPKAPAARHVGLLNTGGVARGLRLEGEPGLFPGTPAPGVARFVFGRRCFFGYFIAPDGDVWWFANPPSKREPSREELLAITSEQWRTRLEELFAGDEGPMLEIIAATERIVPGWNTYDFPRVPVWHTDRMVLIGDAVHATSPSAGQGASLAIEDGVVLGQCLRDVEDPAAAFTRFEALRRERAERVVKHGRRSGNGKAAGPVGGWMRDRILPLVARSIGDGEPMEWMWEHRLDWDDAASSRS